jgi:hypothetical protein
MSAIFNGPSTSCSSTCKNCETESLIKDVSYILQAGIESKVLTAVKKGFPASCSSRGLPEAEESSNWRRSGGGLGVSGMPQRHNKQVNVDDV